MPERRGRGRNRPGVYQRRGKWFYTLDLKDATTGKWHKKWSHAFLTQSEAWQARLEAQGRLERGQWSDPGRMTVGEYLGRWERSRPVGFGMRATTANTYGYQLKWVVPRIGSLLLRDLEPDHVRVLYRELLQSGAKSGKTLSLATGPG